MKKSIKNDIQLLMSIRKQQNKMVNVIKDFNCNSNNIVNNIYAFDLCAM